MTYLPEESRIIYRSKDNRREKAFAALEWLAAMCSHIPDQREQMVRYYSMKSKISGLPRPHRLPEPSGPLEAQGVVRPFLAIGFPPFSLFPATGNV